MLLQVQAQCRKGHRLTRRLVQAFEVDGIVIEIALRDEIHAQPVLNRLRFDADVRKIPHAVELAQAFSFGFQAKWLARLEPA